MPNRTRADAVADHGGYRRHMAESVGGPGIRWLEHPPAPVRWVRDHPQAADGLLAGAFAVAALGALAGHAHPDYDVSPLLVVLALATSLPLFFRRRAPLVVLLVVAAAQVGLELAGADGPG